MMKLVEKNWITILVVGVIGYLILKRKSQVTPLIAPAINLSPSLNSTDSEPTVMGRIATMSMDYLGDGNDIQGAYCAIAGTSCSTAVSGDAPNNAGTWHTAPNGGCRCSAKSSATELIAGDNLIVQH